MSSLSIYKVRVGEDLSVDIDIRVLTLGEIVLKENRGQREYMSSLSIYKVCVRLRIDLSIDIDIGVVTVIDLNADVGIGMGTSL